MSATAASASFVLPA
jgi:DNA-binding transcriptional LysR family regulator